MAERILIIDDDDSIRKVLGFMLEEAGYVVDKAASADDGLAAIEHARPDLVLSDVKMPRKDGIELLGEIRALDPALPVIILTAFASVETAVEAMKRGAADYLTKPIARDDLTMTVAKTLKLRRLEAENADLRDTLRERFRFDSIIGASAAMQSLFDTLQKIAPTDATVLINGESGTGKELIAKAIHYNSPRRAGRMVVVNCTAIPGELLESELFGHVRGAFTGAIRNKPGKFELANGGTIFLDEIGSMPLALQGKLLRVLQEREVERVGGEHTVAVDVRVIAATNRSLPARIREGEFREDLYYRLNVVPVAIPPLRERGGDVRLLAGHFVARFAGAAPVKLAPGAIESLERYPWPGNVRELENFCERIVLMRSGDIIDSDAVTGQLVQLAREAPSAAGPTLPEIERNAVVDALRASGWNRSRAARRLGVPRHILLYRMKKFGITEDGAAGP
ncbi:MAG TPA: sigma-54 dependent transcriptional regulator [Candidatus Krumholzibacteria bacterium]|nr:sigma-54 dependent transcriptional regulator [Candidatus Krumholzibacteria bacterium]